MFRLTFASFDVEPIACEGDDVNSDVLVVDVDCNEDGIADQVDSIRREHGKYLVLWNVELELGMQARNVLSKLNKR